MLSPDEICLFHPKFPDSPLGEEEEPTEEEEEEV